VSPPNSFALQRTPGGHLCGEAASALQKCIRRGLERESLYWASELDAAGYGNYVWKRLRIIATEDVGIADSNVCVQVRTLYENWRDIKAMPHQKFPRIFIVHAVLILVRAPKSRIVDHAGMVVYDGGQEWMEVPEFALDKHTGRGRRMGRGEEHFFESSTLLVNETLEDEYKEEARAVRTGQPASGIQAHDDSPLSE
jgi:replication-associated recombination protein RarA